VLQHRVLPRDPLSADVELVSEDDLAY
jgi:hypothetical protein